MMQERPRVRMEKKQYFDRNIWDMSIDLTYFVLNISKVGISRSTYYISFERMSLTDSYQLFFLSPFLNVAVIFAVFYIFGKLVVFNELFNIIVNGSANTQASSFKSLGDYPSGPGDLSAFRDSSFLRAISPSMFKVSNFGTYFISKSVNSLPDSIVNTELKKSANVLAFS